MSIVLGISRVSSFPVSLDMYSLIGDRGDNLDLDQEKMALNGRRELTTCNDGT